MDSQLEKPNTTASTSDTSISTPPEESHKPSSPPNDFVDVSSETLLSGRRLAVVFSAFMVAFLLVALDQTILSTALPTIASKFNAVSDLSWIASAYFLPQAGFMLFFGRVLAIAPPKAVFLVSIAIFELGSLFCAVSPSVYFLIFGRAVAGSGAAGMWVAIISMIARITTLAQRPVLMGVFGAVFALASIVGPLLGGVFADKVTWRWCFYINLPIGAFAVVIVAFALPYLPAVDTKGSAWSRWLKLDWVGVVLSVAMVTSLLLPLQWGGNEKPWKSPVIYGLFIVFGVLLAAFIAWEYKQNANAILPLQMFKSRNLVGVALESLFINLGFILASYYLPFLYQTRGHSATNSGIDILPFMISGVLATVISGGVVAKTGYAWPILLLSPLLAAAGFGLFYTVTNYSNIGHLIGFQIMLGVGLGSAIQNTIVVAQSEFANREDLIPQATSIATFAQLIGSSVGLAIAGAVFSGQLRTQLAIHAPNLPLETLQAVLTSIQAAHFLPDEQRIVVLMAYTAAVNRVFLIGVPATALGSLASLLTSRTKIQMIANAAPA